MDNDEKEWRKPPAWKVDDVREDVRDEARSKLRRDTHDRINVGIRSRGCRNRGWSGLIPGAIILAVGIIFLLDSLGYVRARHFLQFWPMILIFVGISKIARRDSRIWGALVLLFGIFLQLSELGIGHFSWGQFWPLLLIAGGAMAMWSAIQARRLMPTASSDTTDPRDTLDESAIFGGIEKRLNSREFRGGRLQAIFGGIELDLRDADMVENEAVIHANAIFGGIEMRVPETWFVATRGQGVFGGFSDSTRFSPPADPEKPKKTLIVLGTSLFGGVEIRN
jgi:predicted membrane protein